MNDNLIHFSIFVLIYFQVPALLKDFFGWLRNKYQKYKNEENPSRKEEKVYSLKKIDDDLNEDNENCLSSMITSVVPTSRHGNLRKSLERVNTLDH